MPRIFPVHTGFLPVCWVILGAGALARVYAQADTDASTKPTRMELSDFDTPQVLSTLFHPRKARPGVGLPDNARDGTIPVGDEVVLGYRLYIHRPESPVILFFHGNGEVAPDYDDIAPLYHDLGLTLLVVDYRGYGWSTGSPALSTLLSDAEAVVTALPKVLADAGITGSDRFVMGRSLGSACAIHVMSKFPDAFRGLIIESGFARATNLFRRLGISEEITANMHDPVGNDVKMRSIREPVLIIHGENDTLLPIAHGESLHENAGSESKRLLCIPGAGHNDLLFVGREAYFAAIAAFVEQAAD